MNRRMQFINRFSNGILMICVLAAGLFVSVPVVRNAWQPEQPEQQSGLSSLTTSPQSRQEFLRELFSGQRASAFQQYYDETISLQEPSLWLWTSFRFFLFREGLPGLLVGRDGWLFSSEEFIALPSIQDERNAIVQAVEYIESVRQQLQQHGAELLVVPVPAKARIYEDKLGRNLFPKVAEPRYDIFLQELSSQSIEYIDLVQTFQDMREWKKPITVFLQKDTHWTTEGAEEAAISVADSIKNTALYKQLQKREYHVQRGELMEYKGDLLNFLPLGPFQNYLRTDIERIPELEILAGSAPAIGLFDTAAVPIVLIGTSYSAGEQWGFAAFLQEQLQTEVLNLAAEGRGPYQPMQQYLESDTLTEAPPVIVIWEIPERYLIIEAAPLP